MQQPPLEWKLFLQLLQVSMGCREALECIPTNEQWMAIYHQAERQLLEGIVYTALANSSPRATFPLRGLCRPNKFDRPTSNSTTTWKR